MLDQFLRAQSNQNTRSAYRRGLQRFIEWLGEDKLGTLRSGEIANFVTFLDEEGYEPKSINQMLSAVRSFLRWAAQQQLVPATVYAEAQVVQNVKEAKRLPRPFKAQDVERLLDGIELTTETGARLLAFVELARSSGARLSELVALDIEQLDWDERSTIVMGKGAKERPIFFSAEAAAALVAYLGWRGSPSRGPLFTNEVGERISARWFQKALQELGDRLGIDDVHPHRFRHTFAVMMLRATRSLETVSTFLGHEDPRTTRVYALLAADVLKEAHDQVFSPPEALTPQEVPLVVR